MATAGFEIWWCAMALAVPWLNPFTAGPSISLWQWITTGLIASGVLVSAGLYRPHAYLSDVKQCFIYSWLIAGAVSSLIGLLQYFGVAHFFSPWMNVSNAGEAFANLRQRNQFATLVNIAVLALMWVMHAPNDGHERSSQWGRLRSVRSAMGISLAVLLGFGNAASASRIGLVQLVALALLSGWWSRSEWCGSRRISSSLWIAFSVLISYLFASWLLPHALSGQGSTGTAIARLQDSTIACTSRLVLWSNVWTLIEQRPWTGWGWGELDFAHFMTVYPGARFCEILDNAHNLPLHIAVELGLPAAAVLSALVGLWVWKSRPLKERDPTRRLAWAVLGVIGLHSLVEYPLWYGPFQLAVLACVGILMRGSIVRLIQSEHGVRREAFRRTMLAIFLASLAVFAFIGWDYWRVSQLYMAPVDRHAAYRDDTLKAVGSSWLFNDQVRFAELGMTTLTSANANHIHELAKDMLHFSPEPRVVEAVIESALLLGNDGEAAFYLQRLQLAYPQEANSWLARSQPKLP